MTIKKTKQNVKFVETPLMRHLAALRPILGHWKRGSLTHAMLITTLFQVLPEVHRQTRNNVGSHSMTEQDSSRKPSDFEYNVLYHCVTHPESVREKIVHLLASFFSRNHKSFSLIFNICHTPSQCYYSNFKHVNDGWEVLR